MCFLKFGFKKIKAFFSAREQKAFISRFSKNPKAPFVPPSHNCAFRISMSKWKRWLRQQMADFGLKQTIEKTYIMRLLTLASGESFAIVVTNKIACAERGWTPLNFALMGQDDLKVGHMTEI
jgi:hypothetical protein